MAVPLGSRTTEGGRVNDPEQPGHPRYPEQPAGGHPAPPAAPPPPLGAPPPPPLTPYADTETATVVHGGFHRGLFIAAAVVVVGGIGFALTSLGGSGGAASPEAAVEQLFGALDQEDIIGMAESLRPAERDVLQGPIEDAVGELERLDLLADVDLRGLQGIDIEIDGYQLQATELTDTVVRVDVSGGTVTGSATPDQLPLGQTLRDILEEDLGVEIPVETESETDDLGEFALVAVQDDRGWYVSPGYSIAEAARGDEPLPPFGTVAPVGGSTPEEAVRGLVDAATDLDARAAIGALDPEEMGALYDYAPLFLDDAEQAAAEVRAESGFEATVDGLEMHDEDGPGNTRRVVLDAFHLTASADGDSLDLSFDGDCFTFEAVSTYEYWTYDEDFGQESSEVETDTERGSWCRDTGLQLDEDDIEGDELYDEGYTSFGFPETDVGFPEIALLTVQRDGVWYVTPTRSILDLGVTALRGVEPDDISNLREWFRDFWGPMDFGGFDGEYEERFEAVGEAIGGECDSLYPEDPDSEGAWDAYDECLAESYGETDRDDPYEACWEASDEVYENGTGSGDRVSYLAEIAYERCQQEVIERGDGDKDDFFPSYVHDEPCYEPYESLDPDAPDSDWFAADIEVAVCFSGDDGDDDSDLPDEEGAPVEEESVGDPPADQDGDGIPDADDADTEADAGDAGDDPDPGGTTDSTMPDFEDEELEGALGCLTDGLSLSTEDVVLLDTEEERAEAVETIACMLEFVPEREQCATEFDALDVTATAEEWAESYTAFDDCMTAATE